MGFEGIKPIASLGAALLGRRTPARRVPLSFAPIEELTADSGIAAEVPEVLLQRTRLAEAIDGAALADPSVAGAGGVRARVAFTLRLDPARHARLRQMAAAQQRSAQQVMVEAFDRYLDHSCAGASATATNPATVPSPSKAPTGNQP